MGFCKILNYENKKKKIEKLDYLQRGKMYFHNMQDYILFKRGRKKETLRRLATRSMS
jgi:hypothetical protein